VKQNVYRNVDFKRAASMGDAALSAFRWRRRLEISAAARRGADLAN